jgi:hypothetical protein
MLSGRRDQRRLRRPRLVRASVGGRIVGLRPRRQSGQASSESMIPSPSRSGGGGGGRRRRRRRRPGLLEGGRPLRREQRAERGLPERAGKPRPDPSPEAPVLGHGRVTAEEKLQQRVRRLVVARHDRATEPRFIKLCTWLQLSKLRRIGAPTQLANCEVDRMPAPYSRLPR